ncbi:MAG: flavodoxin family protein [Firmicutes bacterium]|nr:flavodoxin family protein [Bacillota bacterium]
MKVLLVNGSPHENGTTWAGLDEIARTLEAEDIKAEIFWIGTDPVGGCIGCGACEGTGRCAFGGIVNEFLDKAEKADGFVFGAPVHYAGPAGNMKAFMDRVFYAGGHCFRLKPGACIAAARRAGVVTTVDDLNKYLTISEMPVVSSTYWNMVFGFDAKQARQDAEGMLTMRNIGRNMAYLLKCMEAAKAAGIEKPGEEPRVWTHFIR